MIGAYLGVKTAHSTLDGVALKFVLGDLLTHIVWTYVENTLLHSKTTE